MTDIVERLKDIADLKRGDEMPAGWSTDWATPMSALLNDAIAEITRLRATIDQLRSVAGAVSLESGLTFADIKNKTAKVSDAFDSGAYGGRSAFGNKVGPIDNG